MTLYYDGARLLIPYSYFRIRLKMISRVNMQLPLRQSTRHVSKSLTHGTLHPALHLSGLQAQNTALVGFLANMCNMPIVLPFASSSLLFGASLNCLSDSLTTTYGHIRSTRVLSNSTFVIPVYSFPDRGVGAEALSVLIALDPQLEQRHAAKGNIA